MAEATPLRPSFLEQNVLTARGCSRSLGSRSRADAQLWLKRVSIEVAFATPTELKAQFIHMPMMSYERGRIRLQAQQKEASPPYRLVADLPFLSLCAASSPRPDWGGVRNAVHITVYCNLFFQSELQSIFILHTPHET